MPAAPPGHEYRHVRVDVFSGACGAVISGVDLAAELDDDVVAEIRRALLDHAVIFFREQSLTPDEQVAFSRRFGPYSPVPFVEAIAGHPEVIAVVREPSEQKGLVFGGLWHSDFSFLDEPPMGSILHAIEVPPYGADTLWANQYLAYRGLSRSMRGVVEGLRGVHSAVNAYSPKMQAIHDMFAGMTVQTSEDANRMREHPAVRVHAETDKQALFVNAAVHRWPRRLPSPRVEAVARPSLPALDPTRLHVPLAVGRGRRRLLGQPLRAAHGDGRCDRSPSVHAPDHSRG